MTKIGLQNNGLQDPMMTLKATAEYLGISHPTLLRWIEAGAIPAPIQINKRTKWLRKSTVDRAVAKMEKAASE